MSELNRSAIYNLYEAYRRKDMPAIFELLDPDIEVYQTQLPPWGGRYRGYAEVHRFFAKLVEHIDSRMNIERLIDAGEHVVVLGYSRGHVRAKGNEFEVSVAHVWAMQNGRATRFEAYIDTPKMLAALGDYLRDV